MFSKKSKGSVAPTTPPVQPTKPAPPSLISNDLKIVGDLKSDGEIQVDGMIEGDIRTKSLLVGEGAEIKGEIVADTVRVHGRINGQIKARAVLLSKTAHVVGDIMHEDLAIETGAFLEGHCKRMVQPADNKAGPEPKTASARIAETKVSGVAKPA